MRIVFFGSSAFSVPSLDKIHHNVAAVVTKQARPKGRGYQIDDNEVKRTAARLGLPLIEINSFKDENARSIAEYHPDLFVVISFGLIVPRWVLDIPSIAPINIHPSLLPRYRGPSPIQWALLNCDEVTGVTFILMNEKMDEGDILFQETVKIEKSDNYTGLSRRLSEISAESLAGFIAGVGREKILKRVPQDHFAASYCPIVTKEMGQIDWHQSANKISCQVRAFIEWPTAFTHLEGKLLKIYDCFVNNDEFRGASPGKILGITKSGIEVGTGDGSLTITDLQLENKKRMNAYDFSKGYRDLPDKTLN
ncbi:MAG: methionyl-tRNA formyltransferase [Syntrophorhabdaceae bacterium]